MAIKKEDKVMIGDEEFIRKSCVMEKLEQGDASNPFLVVGKSYSIRTVTHYYTGRLIWVGNKELVLEDCAWVADTGRFNEFLLGKTVNEVEPYPKGSHVIIGRGAIVDMVERCSKLLMDVQ